MAEASQGKPPVPMAPPVQDGAEWGMEDWSWNSQTCQAVPKGHGGPTSAAPAGGSALQEPMQALPQVKDGPVLVAMSDDFTAGTSSAGATPAVPAGPPKPPGYHTVRPGFCQADGCGKNLSKLTFYHARNKICDVHIKAGAFTRGGVPLRFCQRCGNAHGLGEFDGNKHSCRAQLEKHNARRRKRQAEAGAPPHKKEKAGKQPKASPATRKNDEEAVEPAAVVPSRRSSRRRTAPSYSKLEDGDADIDEEAQQAVDLDSQTQEGWGSEMEALPVVQLPSTGPGQTGADGPEDVLVDDLSAWLTSHLAEMDDLQGAGPVNGPFASASQQESTGGVAPPLPQSADSFDLAVGLMHPLELICADLSPNLDTLALPTAPKLTKSAMLSTVSVKLFGCTPAELPDDLRSQLTSWFSGNVASLDGYLRPGCVHLTVQATVEPEGEGAGAEAAAAEEGPVKVQEEGAATAGTAALAGTKRRTPEGEGAGRALQGGLATGGVARLVEKMLASGDPLWRTKTLLVQAGTEVALVHGGKLQQAWDVEAGPARRAVPAVLDVQPMVLLAGKEKASRAAASVRLVAKGMNLLQDDCEVVCRLQGEYVPVKSAGCNDCSCAAAVRACCRDPAAPGEPTSSKDWEARCCGCCVAKIASLGMEHDPNAAHADNGQPSTSGGCCGGGAGARPTTAPASVDPVAQQVVSMHVGGDLRPGVLHVDVLKRAYMAPRGGRVLVVDSPAVHEELLALAARAPTAARAWVDALGVVYEWVGDRSKMAYSTVERAASRLLHEALGFGLLETAKTLHALLQEELTNAAATVQLPRSRGPTDGLALLSQADQACRSATLLRAAKLGCVDGLTMVHRAVQSQNPAALDLVLGWGQEAEAPWRCDVPGPRGLTPLHMAVLVKEHADAARMVLTLVRDCEPVAAAWLEAATEDGQVPADFAMRAGRQGLLGTFGSKNDAGAALMEEDDGPGDMEVPATPRRCRCTGDCPCARSAEPCASCASVSEKDDACCGGKDGTCCCCASSAAPEPAAAAGGGCCGAKAAVQSCCQ